MLAKVTGMAIAAAPEAGTLHATARQAKPRPSRARQADHGRGGDKVAPDDLP